MSTKPPYSRISITLPKEVLELADRLAASLGRSRSWVIADGVRKLTDVGGYLPRLATKPMVRERSTPAYGTADSRLGEHRSLQLQADLQLSPEERVRAGEEVARLDTILRPSHRDQLLSFTRYEDYLAWDHRSRIRP